MKKWIQKKQEGTPNKRDSVIEQIAKMRGIDDPQQFLNPTKEELFDPYLMKNIDTAASRIAHAIENDERVVVSFDPDADGLCSASTQIRYLRRHGVEVDYIYGERGDGHGIGSMIKMVPITIDPSQKVDDRLLTRNTLNAENIEKIKNADLLILVDSSSNDVAACAQIREWGTDIIILDHHSIEEHNPHVILVNPQQPGCRYPNKFLSGAGVVFKTMQVVEDLVDTGTEVNPFDYIDLVAVGMYADIMRIDIMENRYLIMEGMRNMKNMGLVTILNAAKANLYKVTSSTIGFSLAPLLNGVARMDQLHLAIDILLEDNARACQKTRRAMSEVNDERKLRQQELTDQYEKRINSNDKILMVIDDQSSKGFNGMIAQQLAERFKRPVIVGRKHKGTVSGSFRSFADFPLKDFLRKFGNIRTMGHPTAGGFEVKEEHFQDLRQYIEDNLPELEDKEPTVEYDLEIHVKDIPKYIKAIEQYNRLCGNGFEKVTVRLEGISVDEVVVLGASRNTVKIKTFEGAELIRFRVNETYAEELGVFDNLSAVGQLQLNEYFNFQTKTKTVTPQLIIEDYKVRN